MLSQSWWADPPLPWITKNNHNLILAGCWGLCLATFVPVLYTDLHWSGRLCFLVSFTCQGFCIHLSNKSREAHATKAVLCICICCLAASVRILMIVWEEEDLRNIRFSFTSVLTKPWLCLVGFPLRVSIPFMVFTSVWSCLVQGLVWQVHGPQHDVAAMLAGEVVMFLVSSCFAILQQMWVRAFYHAQIHLEAEKDTMDGLLTMVCDARVWIAADGKSILRSEPPLAFLAGVPQDQHQEMQLVNLFHGEDRGRVNKAFDAFLEVENAASSTRTALVHASMQAAGSGLVDVDLLIVDRRKAFENVNESHVTPSKRVGFCVGIRSAGIASEGSTATGPSAGTNTPRSAGAGFQQPSRKQSVVPSDTGTCSSLEFELDKLVIEFDAGSQQLTLLSYSALLDFELSELSDAATAIQPCGLHDLVPPCVVPHLDTWVYNEIQGAPCGRPALSASALHGLQLVVVGHHFQARIAWLEISCNQASGGSIIPARLNLREITRATGNDICSMKVQPRDNSGEDESGIGFDDSVSVVGCRRRRWFVQ